MRSMPSGVDDVPEHRTARLVGLRIGPRSVSCAVVSVALNETAPDFVLSQYDGIPFQLSALRGRKVVLFFYPRDNTPGCTAQACAFRDAYEEMTTAGAEVVGVSSDSVESHRRFAASRGLPFPILSDRDGSVRRLYGASSAMLFGTTGRVTYLIDEEGVVRDMYSSVFRPLEHVRRARAWVENAQ